MNTSGVLAKRYMTYIQLWNALKWLSPSVGTVQGCNLRNCVEKRDAVVILPT